MKPLKGDFSIMRTLNIVGTCLLVALSVVTMYFALHIPTNTPLSAVALVWIEPLGFFLAAMMCYASRRCKENPGNERLRERAFWLGVVVLAVGLVWMLLVAHIAAYYKEGLYIGP